MVLIRRQLYIHESVTHTTVNLDRCRCVVCCVVLHIQQTWSAGSFRLCMELQQSVFTWTSFLNRIVKEIVYSNLNKNKRRNLSMNRICSPWKTSVWSPPDATWKQDPHYLKTEDLVSVFLLFWLVKPAILSRHLFSGLSLWGRERTLHCFSLSPRSPPTYQCSR